MLIRVERGSIQISAIESLEIVKSFNEIPHHCLNSKFALSTKSYIKDFFKSSKYQKEKVESSLFFNVCICGHPLAN